MGILKPNFYKQYDYRWARKGKQFSDGYATVGGSGCGPSSVANIVSALTKSTNPYKMFKWFCKHGYMTGSSGSYWSGIPAALKAHGIKDVKTVTSAKEIKAYLEKNYWCVAEMHRGNWTSGGHYITAYYVDNDGYVYISDPASTAEYRHKAKFSLFANQKDCTWFVIDPRQYIKTSKKAKSSKKYVLYVGDSYVNARTGRSTNTAVRHKIAKNTPLHLFEYSNGWYKIYKGRYKGYFVSETCLSKYKHNTIKFKTCESMNVRDGYSTKGTKVISVVPKGKKIISDKQRGRWAHFDSLNGWIKINEKNGKTYLKEI